MLDDALPDDVATSRPHTQLPTDVVEVVKDAMGPAGSLGMRYRRHRHNQRTEQQTCRKQRGCEILHFETPCVRLHRPALSSPYDTFPA
jgi:hypothetical protein